MGIVVDMTEEMGRKEEPSPDLHTQRRKGERITEELLRERFKRGIRKGLRRLDQMTPRRVEWLWRSFIPRGEVTIIEGEPNAGKSWLCMAIAAELSNQGVNILYISNEDDGDTVTNHRMKILGANPEHFFQYEDQIVDGQGMKLVMPRGVLEATGLKQLIEETGARVIFINPLNSYLPHGVSPNDGAKIRPILDYLSLLSRSLGVSFVLLRHFSKDAGRNAISRGGGSIDISAAVRSMMMVGEHPDYEADKLSEEFVAHRCVIQTKMNIATRSPSLAFVLRKDQFAWIETRNVLAEEILNKPLEIITSGERAKAREIASLLNAVFAEGWPTTTKIPAARMRALLSTFTSSTIALACSQLGVVVRHGKGGKESWWEWTSPTPPRSS